MLHYISFSIRVKNPMFNCCLKHFKFLLESVWYYLFFLLMLLVLNYEFLICLCVASFSLKRARFCHRNLQTNWPSRNPFDEWYIFSVLHFSKKSVTEEPKIIILFLLYYWFISRHPTTYSHLTKNNIKTTFAIYS